MDLERVDQRMWSAARVCIALCFLAASALCVRADSAPTTANARKLLRQRITQQSEGRIRLVEFKSEAGPKPAPWDNDGEGRFLIIYEARIEFSEPCVWDAQFEETPVTFKTFKPGSLKPITNRIFAVSRKGEQFALRGQIALKGNSGEWEATSFFWSDPPERIAARKP